MTWPTRVTDCHRWIITGARSRWYRGQRAEAVGPLSEAKDYMRVTLFK